MSNTSLPMTSIPRDPIFDLAPWVGQQNYTFSFHLTNGVTGQNLGNVTPLRNASLTHDTGRTIKRQLTLELGQADTAAINPITDRISLSMVMGDGTVWPLGRYMFTNQTNMVITSGDISNIVLNDEMFLVDQEITKGVNGVGSAVESVIKEILDGLPITYVLEPSTYESMNAWGIGEHRGSILNVLAESGDYFTPWFGNDGKMHFIRTFNPANRIPDFDLDNSNNVYRGNISESTDLLTAPNRFIVISNASSDQSVPVVGIANVPPTAPHSEVNRGYVISQTMDLQISNSQQAEAMAQGFVNRQTIFQTVNLTTTLDPRHDSYNVILWQNELWLELSWSMALSAGGGMNHVLRKAYAG